jgi:protein-L-isoaspartate(D-aspartate) O-methyltransferase
MTFARQTVYDLVKNLKANGVIRSEKIAHVMKLVDRANYCLNPGNAYLDCPQPIGYNATISAPHMHAYAMEYLSSVLTEGAKVLDVGSGSGYLTACFAHLVGPTGKVIGIEHVPELVKNSIENIKSDNPNLIQSGQVKIVAGDGRKGYAEEAPYDCIHVGAYAPTIPVALLDQLKPNGKMFIPTGSPCYVQIVEKDAFGNISQHPGIPVSYVPLTSIENQVY